MSGRPKWIAVARRDRGRLGVGWSAMTGDDRRPVTTDGSPTVRAAQLELTGTDERSHDSVPPASESPSVVDPDGRAARAPLRSSRTRTEPGPRRSRTSS